MKKPTPFEQWWAGHVPACFDNEQVKRLAHEAWIAALEHARQLLREPEKTNEH